MTQQMPSRPPSGAPNGGEVLAQTPTVETTPDGQLARGVRINFRTGKGALGSVFVPDAMYSPENVLAYVREVANRLDQVHGANF
jgi:hypothetical protein